MNTVEILKFLISLRATMLTHSEMGSNIKVSRLCVRQELGPGEDGYMEYGTQTAKISITIKYDPDDKKK